MSRVIQQIASVQFQVQNRQANAAMQALQEAAKDLSKNMDDVNKKIAALGKDIPKDNPQLLNYQNQLRSLDKDLKDVQKAQRDFLRGAKAADQLWKAAQEQNIESLSFRAIKAGQNGLRKRQEGLSPGDAKDMQDWRIIKQVIDEADRVVKEAGADVQHVIQTIREGGKVSEQTMRQTISTLKELKGSVDETDADFGKWGTDLDFMEAKLKDFSEAQRRARGEIVDANDARREMNKLTEEGAAAAKREAEEADRLVQQYKAEGEELARKRGEIKANIEATQQQIDDNHKIIEEKHRQLAADEETFNAEQQGRHATIDGLKTQAEAERKLANEKSDAAETQRRAADLQKQTTEQLTEKVTELQGKLAALQHQKAAPNPVLEGIQNDAQETIATLEEVKKVMSDVINGGEGERGTASGTMFSLLHGLEPGMGDSTVAERRAALRLGGFSGIVDKDEQAGGYMGVRYQQKKFNDMVMDYFANISYKNGGWDFDEKNPISFVNAKGKMFDVTDLRELTEKEQKKIAEMTSRQLQDFVVKLMKEQFGEIKAAIGGGLDETYWVHPSGGMDALKKVMNLEEWKNGQAVGVKETQAEAEAKSKLIVQTQVAIREEKSYTEAKKSTLELIKEEIRGINQEAQAIKDRREEIRQEREEQLAAYEAEKKRLTNHPGELNGAEQRMFEIEQEFEKIGASFKRKKTDFPEEHLRKFESRFGVFSDFFGSDSRFFGRGADESEINAYKNKLYDNIQEGNIITVKKELETIKSLIDEIKQASKDGSIEGNPNLQLDSLKKLRAEYEKVLKIVGDLGEQHEDALIEWVKVDSSEAYQKLMKMREIPESMRKEISELDQKESEIDDRWQDAIRRRNEAIDAEKQKTKEQAKATSESNQQTEEELRLKGELETAQGKLAESKQRENDEQQKYVKLQGEAIEQGNKAAAAENKVADAQSEAIQKQVDFNKKQQEGLDNINQMAQGNQALQQSLDGLNGELEQNSKDYADNATKTAEAEAKKAKARQLSIKTMEDMLAKLKEEYYAEELTAEKRAEHKQKIKELDEALRLAKGEWMSYGDAMKYANSIGSDGFMATDEQTKMATDALTRHREELIKTIQQKEAESQATAKERTELEKLDQALMKVKTGFASADDVMARWAEHMDAGKTTTESMNQQTKTLAQTLEEKLAGATSTWDESIEREKKRISEYNEKISGYDQEIKKFTENIEKMEKELAELEQKHANSSWFRKRTREYRNEGRRIEDLRKLIGKEHTDEDGYSYMTGEKGELALYKGLKKNSEEHKEWWENELKDSYRLKAAELGITEEEVAAEEKKAEAKKLTNEQMQQGINLLEEEYAKTDHTTEEGIKRRQELRTAIDQMNQELKESTGEWMSLADAKNLAEKAGTDGFMTSPQEIQKATQALERHRDAIIQTIKAKRDSGAATDAEEKELTDLTKKLKDLKFEQDNFNMSQAKMQELMRTPTNAVSLDELKAAIKRADGELKRMEGSLGKNSTKYKEFAAEVKNAKNVMKEMEGQAKASATAWEKAWSRLKTYVGLYMGFNIVWQKVQGAASDLMTLSDKMGEVRKTTGFTAEEVGRLSNNLAKLDTRTSLQELMSISAIAGSIGLKTQEQVQGFTEAAQELTVALPEMGDEAARTLMKIADATGDLEKNGGDVRETLERVGSTIIALRANSAAAAGPITDFVSRVGAVGAQAGISIDQIAALGATVDALGGRVEMSATALSRMIPAIKNNAFAVAQAIGMTEKELKGKTGMEQMVAIFRSLHDSVKGFDTSTEKGMNAMADSVEKALGRSASMQEVMKTLNQQGARAGIVFGLLSQNVDKLEEQLDLAGKAYRKNTALMNEYSNMNETAAAKWARLTNQIEEFFVNADATSWLSDIIDMLRVLADLVTDEGPLGRLTRYTVVYLMMMKSGWTESIGKAVLAVYEYVFATNQATAATVADTTATTADTGAKIANAAASETAAAAQGALNKTMKANIITAVLTAVAALGMALYDYSKKAKEAAKQMDVMADVEKKAKEASIDERVQLEKLYRVTQDQTASIEERKKALKDMVGDAKYQEYYSKLSTESELASAAASAYKELSEQILATARARALDAEAEELQRKRIKLEDQKSEREQWENENRGRYRQEQQQYQQQQRYVGRVTGGAMAGFQESQIAQQGASAMKPAIIDEFEGSIRERNRIQTEIEQIDSDLDKLKKQVGELNIKSDTDNGGGGGGGSNPYGDYNDRIDPYEQWDANALVARRKEMLERVRALANGADVQAVLSEDKRFMDEATRKGIKNMRDAIAWYNEERLKIQEELHSRNLTNTGDWMDPKKSGSKRKPKTPESEAAIAELDRYYLERKELIEEARSKEEMTEAEYNRRLDALEQEHLTKRSELRQTFTSEDRQFIQQFRQWWASVEELDEVSWETIEAEWMASWERDRKYNNREAQKDLTAMQAIIVKQLHEIEAIINKERPFNGITTNLQDNLTKMGLLFKDGVEGTMEENTKRLTFLLKESEDAYSLTFEQLAENMRKNGFGAWADAIIKSENADKEKRAIIAQLHSVYDAVQEAIKKEASLVKKQVDIAWNDAILPNGKSIKATYEAAISGIGVEQGRVSRANSLIGAGQASERVADKLAIKQMQLQLAMQEHYYNLVKLTGWQRINDLRRQADEQRKLKNLAEAEKLDLDAKHALMSLNLSLAKEETELAKQQEDIIARTEESQNRLYKELREWGDLLASSLQSVFEASHAGDAEYYNELAKLNLTGKGGPGAGTYIVIDNEGTSDAQAHYEYLDERQALERQREIENQNAQADAWKKVWDDLNNKMNEQITDQLNALLQNQAIDANTQAIIANTEALYATSGADNKAGSTIVTSTPAAVTEGTEVGQSTMVLPGVTPVVNFILTDEQMEAERDQLGQRVQTQLDGINKVASAQQESFRKVTKAESDAGQKMEKSNNSTFAKMVSAANMYGAAYAAVTNDNLSWTQKFGMMAVQAAGNTAITLLTAKMSETTASTVADTPAVLSKLWKQLGWGAVPVFALFTGLLGGLMGLATSAIAKGKSEISQVTGASVGAGRLSTGMLTYAEGNVNEFTDPSTLTPGRSYNVDAADGRTYRAKYTGSNPRTHITNGPEFHLVGEAGREAIIDAKTTRNIQLNEPEIWRSIQTLYNGGVPGMRRTSRMGRGVRAYADGNLDDFEEMDGMGETGSMGGGMSTEMMMSLQASMDRQSDLLERALNEGIKGVFDVHGSHGLVSTYDRAKKEANRHGVKYT